MDNPPIKVFISYAHDDEPYFLVFAKTLKIQLKSRKKFQYAPWDDYKIPVGSLYDNEIQKQLSDCNLAILCISGSFLASDFIKTKELGVLLNKFSDTILAPFLISPCEYKSLADLAKRQLFKPKGDKYDEATNEDFTFADLVRFNKKDGNLIPNPNIDRYVRDFISKIEEALENLVMTAIPKQPEIAKHVPTYITNNYPFFERDSFIGRDELLSQVDDQLRKLETPLLLSGIGGIGKTAVAVAYGKDPAYSTSYNNIAWVDVTENIFSALFSTFHNHTAIPFEYSQDGGKQKDIEKIMQLFGQVEGNNLLIIDNANDEKDLLSFIKEWKKYQPGWKCLVTTRCENNAYKNHLIKLEVISLEVAEKLFKRYNDEHFDKASFKSIYDYIGGHTFSIELLAKFGKESSTINSTAEILTHIKTKGIQALNKTVIAKQGQQQETDKPVSEFLLGLYNPLALTEKEQGYLRYFSVLPATDIEFSILVYLFGIEESDEDNFDMQLSSLVKRGWLMRNASSLKCHQVIQEICREKLKPNSKNCNSLIIELKKLFDEYNATQSVSFFEIGLSVANNIIDIDFDFALMQLNLVDRMEETGNLTDSFNLLTNIKHIFSELNQKHNIGICLVRMGDIYKAEGKTRDAIECYFKYNTIEKELLEKYPDNADYKNNLAFSYLKLGDIYKAEGEKKDAMEYYLEYNTITKDLSEKYPKNVEYKNDLALSFNRLGNIYFSEKKIKKAMACYLQYNTIIKAVSVKYPDIVLYKNNLASSYSKLGDIFRSQGKMEKAMECFLQSNSIEKEVSEKYPDNVGYKDNLANSYSILASISSDKEAKQHYTKAKEIWETLVAKVPQNTGYKENLDWVIGKLNSQ